MEDYLSSRKPLVIKENFKDNSEDNLSEYLQNQAPILIQEKSLFNPNIERFSEDIIIPPLNTDIRFSDFLPLHAPAEHEHEGHPISHPNMRLSEDDNDILIIPPLNTDIRFSEELPFLHHPVRKYNYNPREHEHRGKLHPSELHIHEKILTNFSWAIPTSSDTPLDLVKKSLIHKISTQHACGSCWAVSFADTMSDCFVVSGAVGWSPNISATYIMSCIPVGKVHNMCSGGNPAAIAPLLEKQGVADTSCIDYSWCSGDDKTCKSVSSARHFDASTLASKLNDNIPKPCGCYYSGEKKYLYTLDPNSDVFYINDTAPISIFRNTVRTHILDFGPVIGGYVVLNNFFTGNFTNPTLNKGVYFDRGDYNNYNGGKLRFDDQMTRETAGLHAVSIVGWGVAENIHYDNDLVGDVPYWHCRNSWGAKWGNEGGYFKIAMYPFNKVAQFDKQVMTKLGGPVGSMILIRGTQRPAIVDLKQISQKYLTNIKKQQDDIYYKAGPEKVREINRSDLLDIEVNDSGSFEPGKLADLFKPRSKTFMIALLTLIAVIVVLILNSKCMQ